MPEPLHPGDPATIGPYRLAGRLGAGGQGVVYLGHAPDGNPVAVKVLREELTADPRVRGRFAKEIASAGRIDPSCVARVLDASLEGPRPYIVTEYINGPSLQAAGVHSGPDLQRLAVTTATALAAVHEAGVVHRDFKPANVLLAPDGPRVIDFGIARALDSTVTVTSSVVGTPAYMAPEQLSGQVVGPPADVFAWAAVIVYAATGRPPFGNESLHAVMGRILYSEPDLGGVPEPLHAIVAGCLTKDPADRPAMSDVLSQLHGTAPVRFGGTAARGRLGRKQALRIGAGAALLTAVITAAALWVAPSTGSPPATLAEPTAGTASPPHSSSASPSARPGKRKSGKRKSGKKDPTGRASESPGASRTTKPTEDADGSPATIGISMRTSQSKDAGKDCYPRYGGVDVVADITSSKPTKVTYRWSFDGKASSAPAETRSMSNRLSASAPQPLSNDGPRTATIHVTAPQARQRSFTAKFCA